MKITVRTWASQKALDAEQGQSAQVGEQVAELLQDVLSGQGEKPGANLSGADAERLISTIERTGGARTAAEQKILDFLRGPASDARSKSYLQIGNGEVLQVGATKGRSGGRSVLRSDELARLAINLNISPQDSRAELDARAARVLGRDPALTRQPVDSSMAEFLRATSTEAQAGILEAQREVCRQAAAEFLTGAIASWVENDMPVPPELVGRRITVADVVSPSPALTAFMTATHIELRDQGEITRSVDNGRELGAELTFRFSCNGDLASWRCFYDAQAGYFTTIAILDGYVGQNRTEKLERPA